MKLIKAYIRPIMLEDVYKALREKDYCCITIFKGEGAGKYSDPNQAHGSFNFPAMHSHVVKIEIAARDSNVESIIEIIKKTASSNSSGDGIIFVTPIEYAMRIRDGKEGPEVLL